MKLLLVKVYCLLQTTKNFLLLCIRLYQEKSCQKSAAELTYMTLFAIVPLVTVIYAMLSIIPAFDSLGDKFLTLFFSHMLPSNEKMVIQYIQDFSDQARELTAVGVAFLVASAYFMLKNIEENFNAIWDVSRERRGISNFLLYWAILSLGPLLLGFALLMNTYLISLRAVVGYYDSLHGLEYFFEALPSVLTAAALTLLFVAVPNCKVRISHAILGGFLTMLAFQICKKGFAWMVTHTSLTFIYGAFAVVPLFLLWINLSWMLILAGAVWVRGMSLYQAGLKDRGYSDFFGCLLVLWQFHQAASKGDSITNTELLHLGFASEQWQRLRETLLNHHLLSLNQQNDYVLSRDLRRVTLANIQQLLAMPRRLPANQMSLDELPWFNNARQLLGQLDTLENEHLGLSVADFFETNTCVDEKPKIFLSK